MGQWQFTRHSTDWHTGEIKYIGPKAGRMTLPYVSTEFAKTTFIVST